jgi:hypothetical protein
VLQTLPEGLAIAVLAAAPVDIEHQLAMLPTSLHPYAIEAAFPSIRRHHSLTLDFASLRDPASVLHAATAGTTGASALKELELNNIPKRFSDRLQKLISAACRSASDVRLDFDSNYLHYAPKPVPFSQLETALSHNSSLTSLKLIFVGDPWHFLNLDSLLQSLTGLQSLELGSNMGIDVMEPPRFPAPISITNLFCLTSLPRAQLSISGTATDFAPPDSPPIASSGG